jgi:hypothetical protein
VIHNRIYETVISKLLSRSSAVAVTKPEAVGYGHEQQSVLSDDSASQRPDDNQHQEVSEVKSLKEQKPLDRPQGTAHVDASRLITVLFLAANPSDTTRLRLDREIREIDQALRQAEFRDKFDIRQHWAVRITDLQGYLLRHRPDIVHFSGHGNESSEIVLEDILGNSHPIPVQALRRLFSVLHDNIRCVVLNACYSEQQARAIAEHIDCVIGMSQEIGDSSAISFSTAFYQALAYGRDIRTAFDLGCTQIDLERLDDQDVPRLLAIRSKPEEVVFVDDR